MRDFGQIGNFHALALALAASRATSDEDRACFQRPGRQRLFGMHLVAGVNHAVHGSGQQGRPVAGGRKVFHAMHLAAGVYERDTLAHGLHFGLAQRAGESVNLTVDVGLGHVVQINQRDGAHAAARQRFRRP